VTFNKKETINIDGVENDEPLLCDGEDVEEPNVTEEDPLGSNSNSRTRGRRFDYRSLAALNA
jgi:hypothetical protein